MSELTVKSKFFAMEDKVEVKDEEVNKVVLTNVEKAPSGTIENVLGLDSNGGLVKGTISGGTKLYLHELTLSETLGPTNKWNIISTNPSQYNDNSGFIGEKILYIGNNNENVSYLFDNLIYGGSGYHCLRCIYGDYPKRILKLVTISRTDGTERESTAEIVSDTVTEL